MFQRKSICTRPGSAEDPMSEAARNVSAVSSDPDQVSLAVVVRPLISLGSAVLAGAKNTPFLREQIKTV